MYDISVIIPVYNVSNYLEKHLYSIINQENFAKIEFIYVDDGSTDNSLQILKNIAKDKQNIKVYTQKNKGVSSARNKGISKATAEYICFIDADDYLDFDYFKTLLNYFNYDVVISGFIAEYPQKSIVKKNKDFVKFDSNKQIMINYLKGTIEPNCTDKLFKKNILSDLRFDENLSHSEDKKFVCEYLLRCNKAIIIPMAKYHYVIRNGSAMRKGFDKSRFNSLDVAEIITKQISEKYPDLQDISKSYEIDTKCRVLGEIYYYNKKNIYIDKVKKLKKDIKNFSLIKKKKLSSKKQFLGFVLMRLNPRLYVFFKKNLKMEYANI